MADTSHKKYGPGQKNEDKDTQSKTTTTRKPGSWDKVSYSSTRVAPNISVHLKPQGNVTTQSPHHGAVVATKVVLPVMLVISILSIIVLACLLHKRSPLRRWWSYYQRQLAMRPKLFMKLPTVDITPVRINHDISFLDKSNDGASPEFTHCGSLVELRNGNVDSFLTPFRPKSKNSPFYSETPLDKLLLNLYEGTDNSAVLGGISSINTEGRIGLSIMFDRYLGGLNVNILQAKFLKSKIKTLEKTPLKNEIKKSKRRKSLSPSHLMQKLHLHTPYKTKNKKLKKASSEEGVNKPEEHLLHPGKKQKEKSTMLQADLVQLPENVPFFSSEKIPFTSSPSFNEGGCLKPQDSDFNSLGIKVILYEVDTSSEKVVLGETTLGLSELYNINPHLEFPELWRDLHLENQILTKRGSVKVNMARDEFDSFLTIAVPEVDDLLIDLKEEHSDGIAAATYISVTILQKEEVVFAKYSRPTKNTTRPKFTDRFEYPILRLGSEDRARICIVITLFAQTSDFHRFAVGRCCIGPEAYTTGAALQQWRTVMQKTKDWHTQWHDLY